MPIFQQKASWLPTADLGKSSQHLGSELSYKEAIIQTLSPECRATAQFVDYLTSRRHGGIKYDAEPALNTVFLHSKQCI